MPNYTELSIKEKLKSLRHMKITAKSLRSNIRQTLANLLKFKINSAKFCKESTICSKDLVKDLFDNVFIDNANDLQVVGCVDKVKEIGKNYAVFNSRL